MFFAGRFRNRKTGVLCGGLLALLLGGTAIVLLAPVLMRETWSWAGLAGLGFVGLLDGLLLFTGLRRLRLWFVGDTLLLEITDLGVRYGGRHYAWEDIQWIGGTSSNGRMQLTLKRKGAVSEVQLLVDEPLTVDRYDALMQELSVALRETHPHVAVG